jgi:hypothetical protein
VEIYHVKDVCLHVLAHFGERGPIKPRAGKSVIKVFLDEHMTGCGDLLFQREQDAKASYD